MASEDLPANGHGGPADPKPLFRMRLRAARRAFVAGLAPGERAGLEAGLAAVLDAHLPPGLVAGYRAVGSEIDPGGVARTLIYPRVAGPAPLTFHHAPPELHAPGFGGISEPRADTPRAVPAIILVPLVAVDATGTRLGQGAGYYDRTLATLRASGAVLAVGVAWDMQLVAALPADAWDAPLDALATPSRWLTFPARSPKSLR